MSITIINGKTYVGNSISVINGVVTIDDVIQDGGKLSGVVEIRITEGTLQNLTTDAPVNCNDVLGDVSAGGPVNCENVGGNVKAGGPVNCENVAGMVSAGGSIKYNK